jgi:PIN domain nuclease of toxin-antitoxin system
MDPKRLSKTAAQLIRRSAKSGEMAVASISLFEAAWLFANGRIRGPGTVTQAVRELLDTTKVQVLDLSVDVASHSVQLPTTLPGDQADRLIVATALVNAIPLVTRDSRILESGACKAIW